jgi:hypothetical protein
MIENSCMNERQVVPVAACALDSVLRNRGLQPSVARVPARFRLLKINCRSKVRPLRRAVTGMAATL